MASLIAGTGVAGGIAWAAYHEMQEYKEKKKYSTQWSKICLGFSLLLVGAMVMRMQNAVAVMLFDDAQSRK